MRDQLIRMEPIPGIVKEHEQRLDDIDRHPQYFKNNP
jgi:hypothetical protein